ncbi:cytochrome c-type biogenesis protein CcmH [Bowmanella denitrificans]|uniref:Cytochrome c-type biogenesis protein n=1 Tax=Bowmanella denitrificans TaxID=366582 RepID=A0ABP3HIH5_9ALTE|nr:cytochrome c-type biogenesis protein [Bowmanella denitrificans]
MKRLLVALCALLSVSVFSAEEVYEFASDKQRQQFKQLTEELRCPKCQNQNIADSDALVAQDLKRKVYQLLQQGKSHDEIVAYMKDRYGDFVYYQPPLNPATALLWLGPLLFVGGAVLLVVIRRRGRATQLDQELLAEAEKMLESRQAQENKQ